MTFTKFAQRKYDDYILSNIDYTDTENIVNQLLGFVLSNRIDEAKALADYLIANGLTFTRNSYIIDGTEYDSGSVPIYELKYAYALKKLYFNTNYEAYNTEANSIINRLNNDMAEGEETAGLSTYVLIYRFENLISTHRSGTYISELFPALWLLNNSSENVSEALNCYKEAQEDFYIKSGKKHCFTPFYVRDLSENSGYGTAGDFVFNGPSGDEFDCVHQYKAFLNLCVYYYENFRFTGKRSIITKNIIDDFANWILSKDNPPTSITSEGFYVDNENIYIDNDELYIDQEDIYDFETSGEIIDFKVIIALGLLYKYKVDKQQSYFNYAKDIIDSILETQNSDGSFTFNYSYTEGLFYELLSFYNNFYSKSYFDVVNEALALFKLDKISQSNQDTHPQRVVLDFCKEGIDFILLKRYFEFSHSTVDLEYSSGNYQYDLSNLDVDSHRIDKVYLYNDQEFLQLQEINYKTFKKYQNMDNAEKMPKYFSINGGILYLYNIPDKDYNIKLSHYKTESLENFGRVSSILPEKWYQVLKWFIAHKLAVYRGDARAELFNSLYRKTLSNMTYADSVDLSEEVRRASSLRW